MSREPSERARSFAPVVLASLRPIQGARATPGATQAAAPIAVRSPAMPVAPSLALLRLNSIGIESLMRADATGRGGPSKPPAPFAGRVGVEAATVAVVDRPSRARRGAARRAGACAVWHSLWSMTSPAATAEVLLKRRAELADQVDDLARPVTAPGVQVQFGKRAGDHTSDAVMQMTRRMTAGELAHLIAEIDRALEKLADGTYELCDGCGGPIGSERQEALPWATLCVKCKAASR